MGTMSETLAQASDDPIAGVLSALSGRMPWQVAKSILHNLGFHVSTGWPSTIRKLDNPDPTSDKYRQLVDRLSSIYREHTLVGEKLIKWYSLKSIPEETIAKFVQAVSLSPENLEPDQSDFLGTYPFPVTDPDSLAHLEQRGPLLSSVFEASGKFHFHFCSVRSYRDRIELLPEQFSETDREMLERFEEIYAVMPIRRQCDDFVVFDPETLFLELRLDAPLGMPADHLSSAIEGVSSAFNRVSLKHFGYQPFGGNAVNFYSAIDRMYRNSREGRVSELGFMASATTSTSNNQGKLFRGKNRDLRNDAFHVGGTGAVEEITPYRIGIQWSGAELEGSPQLFIPGTMRMLHKSPVTVTEAFIRHCTTEKDFQFVTDRLHHNVFTQK